MLDPVAVALKFGFIAVLYLFLLWMARSALKDLRRAVPSSGYDEPGPAPAYEEGTGFHAAATGVHDPEQGAPRLRVHSGAGLPAGAAYDLAEGALLGRGDRADIHLEDSFASSNHARLVPHGDVMVVEDLGSTNGIKVNGRRVESPQSLRPGDTLELGTSRLTFELD